MKNLRQTLLRIYLACAVLASVWFLAAPFPTDAKSPKPSAPIQITASSGRLLAFLAYTQTGASPFAPDTPTDSAYVCLSAEQLNAMDKAVRPKLHLKYIDEAHDCDDMSFEWRVLCHRWAIDNLTHDLPLSLAAFVCYVKIHPEAFDGRFGGEGRHALGLICDDRGVWHFVDVQSGMHVKAEEALYEGSIEAFKILL